MQLTWLGWAGAELEAGGATVVVDPLQDAGAVFAHLGEQAAAIRPPPVVAPRAGKAVAGLLTHLHRDHADAKALTAALAPGGTVLEPPAGGGDASEELALAQAEHELAAADLNRRRVAPWESVSAGPFTLTALPASDGVGDPQVAWLIARRGRARPAPRRHDVPRILVAHGAPARTIRPRPRPGERRSRQLPQPPSGQPTPGRTRPCPGCNRSLDPRRPTGDPDPRRGLRDRRHLPTHPGRSQALRRRSRRARRARRILDPGGTINITAAENNHPPGNPTHDRP